MVISVFIIILKRGLVIFAKKRSRLGKAIELINKWSGVRDQSYSMNVS